MKYVEFEEVEVIKTTDKAGLYRVDDEEIWIPFSQVDEGSIDRVGDIGTLSITKWFAEKEELC